MSSPTRTCAGVCRPQARRPRRRSRRLPTSTTGVPVMPTVGLMSPQGRRFLTRSRAPASPRGSTTGSSRCPRPARRSCRSPSPRRRAHPSPAARRTTGRRAPATSRRGWAARRSRPRCRPPSPTRCRGRRSTTTWHPRAARRLPCQGIRAGATTTAAAPITSSRPTGTPPFAVRLASSRSSSIRPPLRRPLPFSAQRCPSRCR